MASGLTLDFEKSNTTTQIYTAFGSIMSIKDYNDVSLVDSCLKDGCLYNITSSLIIGNNVNL